MRNIVYALLLVLGTPLVAQAQALSLYVMEVPPMTSKDPARHGVVGDITIEAMRRAKLPAKLMFVPNNRAIATVAYPASRDLLIIPLARVPEREAQYTWIAPLYQVERSFFTLGRGIASMDEARRTLRSVGVARGTVSVILLREQGFTSEQIYEMNDRENVPKMLLAGRIDAWFGPTQQMAVLLRGVAQRDRVRAGPPVASTINYLACSKQCNPALVAKLSAEIAKMEADSTSKAIRANYGAATSAPLRPPVSSRN